jgi:hypothetical protein
MTALPMNTARYRVLNTGDAILASRGHASSKIYRGEPNPLPLPDGCQVFVVTDSARDAVGKPLRHTCLDYERMTGHLPSRSGCHSPSGFAWGYLGSGPSELARMILRDLLGRRVTATVYQAFKEQYVARFPTDSPWVLSAAEILEWLADASWRRGLRTSEGGPPISDPELYGQPWEHW